jgi:hypothetical protein
MRYRPPRFRLTRSLIGASAGQHRYMLMPENERTRLREREFDKGARGGVRSRGIARSTADWEGVAAVAATIFAAVASSAAAGAPLTVAGFVQVDGHRMYYECRGRGSPTVILDAGSPDTSSAWRYVQPKIAQRTHVCAYDRAGLGLSDPPPPGRRTPLTQVHELHALLAAAKLRGPYVRFRRPLLGWLPRPPVRLDLPERDGGSGLGRRDHVPLRDARHPPPYAWQDDKGQEASAGTRRGSSALD